MPCSCENCECQDENVKYSGFLPSRGDLLLAAGALLLFALPALYTLLT